jgi:hypothetical protein
MKFGHGFSPRLASKKRTLTCGAVGMKFWVVFWMLLGACASAFSLDREAFTFSKYDLNMRVEPGQQRLGVRGIIALRNDSSTPQKTAVLQISSSLTWRSIQADRKPLQFVSQPYTSDVDHTGELSEAIVSLPAEVPPGGGVELEVGYEGVILLDATRLTRMGMPNEMAVHSDWDQIGKTFTAVRGVGYVAWYPVAMEAASLSDGNAVFETVGRWKRRHMDSKMSIIFGATDLTSQDEIHFSGTSSLLTMVKEDPADTAVYRAFDITRFGSDALTFVLANYQTVQSKALSSVGYISNDKDAATACVEVLDNLDGAVRVGRLTPILRVLELPDRSATSFAADGMFLTPLKAPMTLSDKLMLVYAYAREEVQSSRWWIRDGLGRYAQAAFLRQTKGREAALEYLKTRLGILVDAEKTNQQDHQEKQETDDRSLINSSDEAYVQTKAMYVWWMLNDMVDDTVSGLMLEYQMMSDTRSDYLQHLIETRRKRDLQWFFDDWVYHDRGLPDFRVESAYVGKATQGNYLTTVTVENLGSAGAEVPVTVHFDGGDLSDRVVVRAKSKGVLRIATPKPPTEVTVNDGSVPETDTSNNSFKVTGPAPAAP